MAKTITYWIIFYPHGMVEFVLEPPTYEQGEGCIIKRVTTELPEGVNWVDLN